MVLKYDASGALQWMRTWDGPALEPYTLDSAGDVVIDTNGDLVVLIHGVMGTNHPDYVVVKYAPDTGDTIWTSIVGVFGEDAPRDMELDANGDIYVTGTYGVFQESEFFTIKLRGTDGMLLWQAYDSLAFTNSAMALALDGVGGVYVTGTWDPDEDVSNSNDNMRTIKRDAATGALLWAHVYGSSAKFHSDQPSDVVADPAGHVFVGGYTNSPPYTGDMITLVLDAQTGAETDRHIIPGGPGLDAGSGIMAFDADFNLFNGGQTVDYNTGAVQMSLVKFTTLASTPYQMNVSQLVGGSDATFAVSHATPLQMQFVVFSLAGTAALPIPSLGITLGLSTPILLTMAPADASGSLAFPLHIPTGVTGVTAWFQTVQKNGATPVVKRTVQ
jgi:outer membrane protein assembly factor BamB